MAGRSPEDQPLPLAQLAREAEVSARTLSNWSRLGSMPLQTTSHSPRSVRVTWTQLRAFCEEHPEKPAAVRILAAEAAHPFSAFASTDDPEQVRASIANLRSAAAANLQAILIAARQAEATARSHREQIEQLAVSLNSYDDMLTQLTAPTTPHD